MANTKPSLHTMEVDRMATRWFPVVLSALSISGCYGGVTSGPFPGGRASGSHDDDDGNGPGGFDSEGDPADEDGTGSADGGNGNGNGSSQPGSDSDDTSVVEPPPGTTIVFRGEPVYSRFVRLTHEQWERGVRDLLRLPDVPGLANTFVPDPPAGKFANNERRLQMTEQLTADYTRVAAELAVAVTSDSSALSRLTNATDGPTFVREFGLRAFRRPLEPEEQERYEAMFASAGTLTDSADPFVGGVRLVIEAMLQSPHFVYRVELAEDGERLSSYELATKLALFLRNTIPDEEGLSAAASGRLDTNDGLRAEAERLMAMPDSIDSIREFYVQLFRTFRYEDIEKDTYAFPDYDKSLNADFLAADLQFFDYIYESNKGLRDLLLSTVGFVTPATAPLYGVEADAPGLTQIDLPERPGYFTRLGFLSVNGTLRDPDPIHRGVEMLKEVMCIEIPPPAGEIPPLPPQEAGVTNRERVNGHTGPGTCGASCHGTMINPIGFAFEHYDALGIARELDNGYPVDASGSFAFGTLSFEFNDAVEMLNQMSSTAQAQACFAKHIAEFVLARDLTDADASDVYAMVESGGGEAPMKDLLLSVILSPSFVNREGAQP